MRKPNRKAEAIQQRKRRKMNASKKRRRGIRQERLNHRQNVIEAKKMELFERWVAAVNKHFEATADKE